MTMKRKSNFQMTTMSIENTIICFIFGSIFPLQTTSTTIEIAKLVGRNVSLTCPQSSSDGIKWIFNKDNTDTYFYEEGKFKGIQFKDRSRFENDSATGKEILKISDIKPEDAGLYRCQTADSTDTALQSTQLTVLGSEPSCYSNIENNEFIGPNTCGLNQDEMHFSCTVSYHGTKTLRLQWETANGNQIFKECDESQPNRISCNLTLKAEPRYDGSVFRCRVVTSHGEQYTCSTKAIKVHYFIRDERDLTPKHKAIDDKISCSVESNLTPNFTWIHEESKKEDVVGSNHSYDIKKKGLYYCNVSYSIKNTSCSAVVSVVYAELSLSHKNLAIVTCLVLFVFAVVSHYYLKNEQVKSTLENIGKIFVTGSKMILLILAVLGFALLLLILASPTGELLIVKYAHTVALLLVTFVKALLLLLLQCKNKVSSCTVKVFLVIPCLLVVLSDVGIAISAAVIVIDDLWGSSHGTTDEWATIFILILAIFTCLVLVAFGDFAIVEWCCKWPKEWAPRKRDILSALKSHGAINDSDYKKILLQNDEDKALSMLIDAIRRGSEEDYGIFKLVIKEISEIDLGDVEKKDPKTGDFELRALLSGGRTMEGRAAAVV